MSSPTSAAADSAVAGKRVAVIGAGVAGLLTSIALRKVGAVVDCYEAYASSDSLEVGLRSDLLFC